MTGPEHYREAERLLAESAVNGSEGTYFVRPESLAAAQVHATLALAAATAGRSSSGPMPTPGREDRKAWAEVAITPEPDYDVTESIV